MARLLVASVIVFCALCQSAFGILLRGEATAAALRGAPSLTGVQAGTEVTLTFAVETEFPYIPASPEMFMFESPTYNEGVYGGLMYLGPNGFGAGDGTGAHTRASFRINAPGVYGDPSIVLTPAMMPTATFIHSYYGQSTNREWVNYIVIQDAPITWYYVPEPSSYALGLLALGVLFVVRRK